MITFTQMRPEHVEQIAQLEKQYFSSPWDARSIASELKNDLSLWLVALEDDCVVGYIGSQTVCGETDMMNVAVQPDYRRRGVGQILVEQLIAELKNRGSSALSLEVRISNQAAIALYTKLGFRQVGCRPNYYRAPKEDALILRKEWEA